LADAEVVKRFAELGVGHGASNMAFADLGLLVFPPAPEPIGR
jgi:hypothetical protein